jgi:hypothetical protein
VETVPGWPSIRLSLPDYRRPRQSLPISSFPTSLREEFANYIDYLRGGDLFADEGARKPLAPSTGRQGPGYDYLARMPGGGLCVRHHPAALCREWETQAFAYNIAQTLITLARHWVKLDPTSLGELEKFRRCLGPQPKRLTEKNRTLLRTLDDPDVRAKLFLLPERLATWAERATPVRGAIAMEIAVAVAILQNAPLRVANLAGLRLDRHLVRPGGPRSLWQVDIPPHEVKNDQALTYELPRRARAPVRLSTSSSIRRCAAKPTISRSKSASELFSSSVRRLIISSVIVRSSVSVEGLATKPYRRSAMTTAMDKWPAVARLVAVAAAGHLPTAPYTTSRDTTKPPVLGETGSSNPVPSNGESRANQTSA